MKRKFLVGTTLAVLAASAPLLARAPRVFKLPDFTLVHGAKARIDRMAEKHLR